MLLSELDEEKNCNKGYVLGNEYVGMWESGESRIISSNNNNSTSYSYYLTNEHGSIRFTLNETANVENYYQYSAFGENLVREEKVSNRLRYNAQIEDELTSLYYLRARYYNPMTGRFTQEDVIYNDGLNLYAYCNSNPVMYCDPSGFAKKPPCKDKTGDGGDASVGKSGKKASKHHEMTGYVTRDGEAIFKGEYVSGGGKGGYQDGLLHHTERKFLNDVEKQILLGEVVLGDHLNMIGELNPCRPGCQPAIRKFVQDNGVTATYVANGTGKTFYWSSFNDSKVKGTVLQTVTDSNGNIVGRWRYWQKSNGRWKRAKY